MTKFEELHQKHIQRARNERKALLALIWAMLIIFVITLTSTVDDTDKKVKAELSVADAEIMLDNFTKHSESMGGTAWSEALDQFTYYQRHPKVVPEALKGTYSYFEKGKLVVVESETSRKERVHVALAEAKQKQKQQVSRGGQRTVVNSSHYAAKLFEGNGITASGRRCISKESAKPGQLVSIAVNSRNPRFPMGTIIYSPKKRLRGIVDDTGSAVTDLDWALTDYNEKPCLKEGRYNEEVIIEKMGKGKIPREHMVK